MESQSEEKVTAREKRKHHHVIATTVIYFSSTIVLNSILEIRETSYRPSWTHLWRCLTQSRPFVWGGAGIATMSQWHHCDNFMISISLSLTRSLQIKSTSFSYYNEVTHRTEGERTTINDTQTNPFLLKTSWRDLLGIAGWNFKWRSVPIGRNGVL